MAAYSHPTATGAAGLGNIVPAVMSSFPVIWLPSKQRGQLTARVSFDFQAAYDELNPAGHVAQIFTGEDAWLAVLRDLHRALVPGGLLAFESRNPGAREWESWTRELTLRTVETPDGPVEFWHETAAVDLPLVSYDTLTRNLSTGEANSSPDVLAFRDEQALRASVEHVGFEIDHVYGDWDRTAPTATSPELIMIARRP
jgi:hypothetical protein